MLIRQRFTLTIAVMFSFLWISSTLATSETRGIRVKLRSKESPGAPVAEEVNLYGSSYALVVGIDNYTRGWPRLSNAIRDAKLVGEELRRKGFEVTLKTNLKSNELEQVFKEFFIIKGDNTKARLFVWFAGHGHTLNGEGFLVPADAPRADKGAQFRLKALSMRRFGEYVRLAQSKHSFAVFDSCFSGTIFTTQRSSPPIAVTRATTLPVRQFLSSGDAQQQVSDDGMFRKLFVRAIRGEERADANGDGYLTGSELGLFLTDRMTNLTRSAQTPRYGKLRDPDYDRGDFVFLLSSSGAVVEESVPKSSQAYLSVESNVSGAKVLVDGSYIGTTNLSGIKISPGEHRVRVEKDGYEPYFKRVRFISGRNMSLTAVLDKKTAPKSSLYVETQPDNATVRILNIGPAFYQGMELDAGMYTVEVSADGYETKKLMVTLGSGEDKSIDVRLIKRAVAPSSSYPSYSSAREIKRDGRFIAYDNGTVKDTKTGLMWASKDNGENINWKTAKQYCENYRGGGYTDWRMPTIDELAGLYDKSESYQLKRGGYDEDVHLTKLIQLTECCPWTSNRRDSEAKGFYFGKGNYFWNFRSYSGGMRALPVRGGK